jgi:hypothetical protein
MNYILLKNKSNLTDSLYRYFHYIYRVDFVDVNHMKKVQYEKYIFFVDEDYEMNESIMNLLCSLIDKKIIVLGLKEGNFTNYINLLFFDNINENIKRSLSSDDFISLPLLYLDSVKKYARKYVKTHGDDSVLNNLNWAKYYLTNGADLLMNNSIDPGDYLNSFYKVGIEYWNKFYSYFYKNEIYLRVIGLEFEASELSKHIKSFQNFLDTQLIIDINNIKVKFNIIKENLSDLTNINKLYCVLTNQITKFYAEI